VEAVAWPAPDRRICRRYLLRLLGESQRLNAYAFSTAVRRDRAAAPIVRGAYVRKSGNVTPCTSHDLAALHRDLDKTWTMVLTLPIGKARTNLELIQQSNVKSGINMKKILMEMV
jgi:hypothetical protein